MFYEVARVAIKAVLWLLIRCEVNGLENVPRQGPLIVVSNHLNIIDPPLLGTLIPRRIRFMAKAELFHSPFTWLIVTLYGAFPVRRGALDRQALREAMRILQNGGALGMFPEGTRSRTGQMQQARQGSAMVAVWSGAPVLPVGITGSDCILLWPNIIRRPRLVINVGPPFMLQAPGNGRSREALEDLNQEMMRRVAVLLPEAQRGLYADVQEHRD